MTEVHYLQCDGCGKELHTLQLGIVLTERGNIRNKDYHFHNRTCLKKWLGVNL